MNKLLSVIAAILIAIPFHAPAQETPPSDPSVGKWVGNWESRGRPAGSMEMLVDVRGDQVFGQIRSTGSPECSLEWVKLAGVVNGNSAIADYNLGGRCGKVEIIYSIDQAGKIMTGSLTSQYPGKGSFRLTKQPAPPVASTIGAPPITTEQRP